MKELKLRLDNQESLEQRLIENTARFSGERWTGNWYLETLPSVVRKIVLDYDIYYYLELLRADDGFSFHKKEVVTDIGAYNLEAIAPHNILHKTVRSWSLNNSGIVAKSNTINIDILKFEDIPPHFCITFSEESGDTALTVLRDVLGIHSPSYIKVPFNVLKRRALGVRDFD